MKSLQAVREPAETLLVLLGLLFVWEVLVRSLRVPTWLLPPPSVIWVALRDNAPLLGRQMLITGTGALLGLALGTVSGVVLATLMASFRLVELAAFPLLLVDQSIPKVALAPLFILWFGSGMASRVIIAMVIALLPIVINTAAGLSAIDPRLGDLMRTLSAGRMTLLLNVRLPSAVPAIFSAVKVAVPLSIIGAVVAEFLQSDSGLGYVILVAVSQDNMPLIFVAITLMALLSLIIFTLVRIAEAATLRRRFSYLLQSEAEA